MFPLMLQFRKSVQLAKKWRHVCEMGGKVE